MFSNKKVIPQYLLYAVIASFWVYNDQIPIIPLGLILVVTILIIRKEINTKKILIVVLGTSLIFLKIGPYITIEHPIYKLGFRFCSDLKTEAMEIVENISLLDSVDQKIKVLEEYLLVNDNNPEIYNLLGWNYLKLEKYSEGIDSFEKALSLKYSENIETNLIIAKEMSHHNMEYYQYFGTLLLNQENDYTYAIKFLLKSISSKEIEDDEMLNTVYYNLAASYY